MKKFLLASALLIPMFAVGCSKSEGAPPAMKDALPSLDLSKLSPDAMKAKGTDLVTELTSKLDGIKDLASAEGAAKALEPLLGNLGMLKDKLGLASMDMSSVQTAITSLTTKFGADTKIMEVLKPLLEKIQGLLK